MAESWYSWNVFLQKLEILADCNMLSAPLEGKELPDIVKTGKPTLIASIAVRWALYGNVSKNKFANWILFKWSSIFIGSEKIILFGSTPFFSACNLRFCFTISFLLINHKILSSECLLYR